MNSKLFLLVLLFAGCRLVGQAQGVAINPYSAGADNSAGLDVDFPDKGILFPRLTEFQRNSILLPATGLLCFQTDNQAGIYVNSGTPASPSWTRFTTAVTGWQTTGNEGTIDYTHFLGTTDSVPLNFRVNGQPAGRISPDGELRLGYKAARLNSGTMNTIIGSEAMMNNMTGSGNVALGYQAGYYETGSNKLYIDNSASVTPLIYGDFTNNTATVNGKLGINIIPSSSYVLDVNGAIRAPLLYDFSNTSFFLDPASVSVLSDVRAFIYYDQNNTSFYTDPSSTSVLNELRASVMYDRDDNLYYLDPGNTVNSAFLAGNVGLGVPPTSSYRLDVNGALRAALIYDYSNTSYFMDPASVSILNDVRASIFYDQNNTSFYLVPSTTSNLNELRATIFYDRENTTYFLDPSSTTNSAFLAGSVGVGVAPSSSYKLDVNGAMRAPLLYDYNNTSFFVDPASVSFMNDVRATLFYDRENTSYYVDPASTSYLSNVYISNLYSGIYYDRDNSSFYVNPAGSSYMSTIYMSLIYDAGNSSYYLDPASVSCLNDVRAHILYDQGNTSYYLDLSSTGTSAMIAGNVCIGGVSATEKLEVYTASTVGKYTTSGWTHSSDARLKKNVLPLDRTLDKVLQLKAKRFDYIAETSDASRHIGFLAQEVEPLFPEFVVTGADGYKSITYGEMVPVLSEAIREQQQIILKLETQNRELRSRIEQLETGYGDRLRKLEEALGQDHPVASVK